MVGFLKYFNASLKESRYDSRQEKTASIKEDISSILCSLKKEEMIIEANIAQIELADNPNNKLRFSFDLFNNYKIEDKVRDQIKEYQQIAHRVNYLSKRLSSKKIETLSLSKEGKSGGNEEVVAKVIRQQTAKVEQMTRKTE